MSSVYVCRVCPKWCTLIDATEWGEYPTGCPFDWRECGWEKEADQSEIIVGS
jgi:hypothetical protein